MSERKLATIRTIDAIESIEGADLIEVAVVGGWRVIVKRNEYKVGDLAVYLEIDSFLPEGNAAWQFLVDKSNRIFDGVKGHVLRTVKLRGVYSQGLLLPLEPTCERIESELFAGLDVTYPLGIVKYEPPVSANLAGLVKGNFPTVIPKTDLERIQNLSHHISVLQSSQYEVTEKIEGTSATFSLVDGEFVVCSRNLSLKPSSDNTYWQVATEMQLEEKIKAAGFPIAIQGEIFGEGIQGNIYKVKGHRFACFDIVDLRSREYLLPEQRQELCKQQGIPHVPVIHNDFSIANMSIDGIVSMADGASTIGVKPRREGLSFKQMTGQKRFKSISNLYLAKQS
ncbi:RNA_lig_DRB0094, RNA ligase [uncultured Caudovirales phage]|uniref:RNA_lig_DRB0094, RNA ligase n=1 Tax=uncultured Caudovirales phage TaxID=2100421 RepID=A0A6J5LB66_9CAUD|nr:RNA_lig_DRB0094, RNA ligase [uncultured Caudovirales phage]